MEAHDLPYKCDLIMKGGITSGVVYPPAIAELAKDHRFYSIGGASAGALAAAAAAAAEFGRQSGQNPSSFVYMDEVNPMLAATHGTTTKLESLVQPQASTRRYFNLMWALKKASRNSDIAGSKSSFHTRVARKGKATGLALWALVMHSAPTTILALLGISLIVVAVLGAILASNSLAAGIAIGIVACLGFLLWAAGSVIHLYRSFDDAFVGNHLGLCTGITPTKDGITDWLHDQIQRLAFGSNASRPLTYGDLDAFDIELVTMTTNASQGESLAFPFADEDAWAFHRADAIALFPSDIASYLIEYGEETRDGWVTRLRREELPPDAPKDPGDAIGPEELLPLPPAWDLPVLLGARLSYPIPPMLSAFPLYRRVRKRDNVASAASESCYEKVWLTDGGLCSNLPVHLFDAALPSRPTYAISLSNTEFTPRDPHEDEMVDAHRRVQRPTNGGLEMDLPVWKISTTSGFLKLIFNATRNWSDNSTQSEIGVRDRICTIELGPHEGGFNLDMTSATIEGLRYRGSAAGENLAWMVTGRKPALDPTSGVDADSQWLRHRWIRMLATIEGSAKFVEKLATRAVSEDIVRQDPLARTLDRPVRYEDLRNPSDELREALGVTDEMWTEDVQQTLDEIITKLVDVPFDSAASLDVSESERKLVLSTRRPTTTITNPWDDMDRDGIWDSADHDADGDGTPHYADVDDLDPNIQRKPGWDSKDS